MFLSLKGFFLAVLGLYCCTQSFSSCSTQALERGLSGCGEWAQFPLGVQDRSCQTTGQTCVLHIGRRILIHWTTKEVPLFLCLCIF